MVRPIEGHRQNIDNQMVRNSSSSAHYYAVRLAAVLWNAMHRTGEEGALRTPPQIAPRSVTPTPPVSDSEDMEEVYSPRTSIDACAPYHAETPER